MAGEVDRLEGDLEGGGGSAAPAGEKAPAGGAKKGGKKTDPKAIAIVLLTFVGVIIAWLSYRKSKGGAATDQSGVSSSALDPSNYPAGTGTVAGSSGSDDTNAVTGLETYLQNLTNQIQANNATSAQPTTGSSTSTSSGTTAPTTPHSVIPTFNLKNALKDPYVEDLHTRTIYQVQTTAAGGSQYVRVTPQQLATVRSLNKGKNPKITTYNAATAKPKAK